MHELRDVGRRDVVVRRLVGIEVADIGGSVVTETWVGMSDDRCATTTVILGVDAVRIDLTHQRFGASRNKPTMSRIGDCVSCFAL